MSDSDLIALLRKRDAALARIVRDSPVPSGDRLGRLLLAVDRRIVDAAERKIVGELQERGTSFEHGGFRFEKAGSMLIVEPVRKSQTPRVAARKRGRA